MSAKECALAQVTVTTEIAGTITLTVPAYSRTTEDFVQVLENHVNAYLNLTMLVGARLSLADFALGLLAQAALEPRWVES